MDVPVDVLEELKCGECAVYLSRGPVYLQHDGAAMCGRCFSPKHPATRNKEYEAVAKLLRFPCKNKELGCGETVGFVVGDEEVAHEARCEYRQYVCPVLGSSRCEWLGTRSQLLQHCQAQHPDHVLDNPCTLAHDIATSSLHNYLLQAYQLLFLLLTKVCVTSGRLYHSVRLLDTDDMAKQFSYTLNIRRGDEVIIKKGLVAGQGCLALQEPTALGLDINSLLSVLGGWGGTSCTVALQRQWKENCSKCTADVTVKLYHDDDGWRCERCVPARRACEYLFEGCTHQDIPSKCGKHESYFCQQGTTCNICSTFVPRGTLSTHCSSRHKELTHGAGSTWRVTRTDGWRHCLVICPVGTAVCWYMLDDLQFHLDVYIPVFSERLCEYRCEIRVTQPATGRTHTYTPDITYENDWDWSIEINEQHFPYWTRELDISVNITKI